jgi:hypothetical protein
VSNDIDRLGAAMNEREVRFGQKAAGDNLAANNGVLHWQHACETTRSLATPQFSSVHSNMRTVSTSAACWATCCAGFINAMPKLNTV